jgi:hypothetical protein
MNHNQVSNILFGCAVAAGFESFILVQHELYNNAFAMGCLAILVMWQSWIVFTSNKDK